MIRAPKGLIRTSLAIAALLTVLFAPHATQAQVCAVPGNDGPGGTLSGIINTYYPGTANASAGSTSISVGTPTGSATPIAVGDLLLVIQMQDAAISYAANDNTYGDGVAGDPGSGSTNLNSSGRYEYVVATSTAGATVSIRGTGSGNGLVNSYNNAAASGSQGQRRFQVIRVPQYSTATLSSGLTARRWDGSTGGILVFDVAGALSLGSSSINLDGYGFRGAGARQLTGGSGGTSTDYVNVASNPFHAGKGEGIAGTPRFIFDPATSTVVDNTTEGYPGGSFARGAPGNAGGGGTDTDISQNQENSGGGGGSNYGAGGKGGKTWQSNLDRGGHGGAAFTAAASNRMIMGGGGGAGTRNNSSGVMSSGGAGGGIVMFRAGTISGSATISVNGLDGTDADNDGGGGGGAGGSVLVSANSGGIGSLTINARGGNGADAWPTQAPGGTPGERHGPGGGGGGGFIAISGSATTNISGGANGITTTASDSYGATPGSTGSVLSISSSEALGAGSGAQCFPTLTTTKTTSTATVINTTSGTTATYSIVVSNAANRGSAISTTISDALPSGFTFSSTTSVTLAGGATRPSTSNPTGGSATPAWGTFTIPGSGSVTIVFVANIASSVAAGTYQNPATTTYADPARSSSGGTLTSNYSSGSSTGEDVLVTVRDMTITKSHTGNFTQGQVGAQYILTAANSGTAATTGTVTVTDTLPAGLTPTAPIGAHNGWSCGIASQTLTCTRSDALAAGSSYPTITVTVTVANNAAASVTNTAAVSGGGQINTSNDSASDPTTINQLPDMTITKTHTGNFTQGQVGATYTLTARNSGFAATSGTVTVTDTLPAGLTPTAPIGAHNGWTCGIASQTVTCTRSDALALNTNYPTITITVTVANNAAASVTNTASVSGGGQTNTTNDTASDPTTINQLPDMTITKSHSGNFTQGQVGATYTITATNSGGAATSGTVTVTDTLPAGLTPTAPIGAHNGWTCGIASQTLTCTRSNALAGGSSYPTITLTVTVAGNAPASVTNSVSVSGGGQTNTTNDTASDPTTINQLPDMTITKSHSGNFTQGQVGATYTITATNSGSGATSGTVTVTDTLPAGLTPTAPIGAHNGWACGIASQTVTCTRSDALAAGSSYPTITVTVTVANNAAASVTNTASVSGGGQTNTTNDTASDPTTINQLPDMTITKSHSGSFQQGQVGATYTLTARNSGFATTSGTVTVSDTLPAGLTPTAPIGAHNGWTCGIASQTVTCTRSDALAINTNYPTITITVDVANNAAASVTNTASVSGGGQTNTTNDTASDVTAVTQMPDLTVNKSHTGNFSQGQVGAQYSIVVTNSGFATTSGTVTVVDTLPAGLTPTGPTGTSNGWTCNIVGQTLTCTRSTTRPPGGSFQAINLTVNVAANAPASVTNTVTVSGGGQTNTTNDTDSDPTTIVQPDLTIAKTHSGNFSQGQVGAQYTLTVTNSGTASTTGAVVTVTDTLPAELTPAGPIGAHNGWTCGIASQTLTCTRSTVLTAGSSYPTITLTVNVASSAPASVTNTASVSGGGQSNTANDTASDPTTIDHPDMTITKSHSGNFTQGQVGAQYIITATNSGLAATNGTTVTVTDTLPAGLTPTAPIGAHNGWTCGIASQTVTCTRTDVLAASASYPTITVTVTVANNAAASVTNSVSVSGGGQLNTANDSATDPTTITQLADMTITKSHTGNFTQGQVGATYTITATNSGAASTNGTTVTVTDTLPAGLTPTGPIGAHNGWTCGIASQTVTCTRTDVLAAGSSYPAITLTVNVANNAAASVTNSVTVSGGGQIITTNDTATDPTNINQLPDMTITKSHTGNFTQGQVGATYTITATNSGAAATNGSTVTVTDTLPAGLTPTAPIGAHNGWTCGIASQTVTCTRSDVLAAGLSYPAVTVTVTVANNAPASVTNSVSVSGGGQIITTNDTATDPTTINQLPDMTITKTHTGNFTQGQVGAQYIITATNSGSAATNGTTVTVTDTLPAGLTPTGPIGAHNGWTCGIASQTVTCTRTDVLAASASYPTITVTVTVANNAAASVTNSVSVSGGGQTNTANDTATDPTTITQLPDMTITKTHSGNFTQGQVGATYTITATNSGSASTNGTTVTVTDTLPAGLTPTAPIGAHNGWTCGIASQTVTCTRTDVLAASASYPTITVTVTVANNAPASVTNTVSVSGGGQTNTANDTASDPTTIDAGPPIIGLVKSVSPLGPQTPGSDLTYTIVYTNTGGKPASNFVITDPNMANVDPLERVFHNLDFKVGSMTSSPGTSGLVATFVYSNDGGTTWTYTPVSGGGGAPAGYDRNVTNVRWTFAGNLSHTSPNNTGSVTFMVRIR